MQLFWHRRDLSVEDNLGLSIATDSGPVIPIFVLDREILTYAGAPRVAFLLAALASLRSQYRERGSDLLVRTGDPREVVPDVAREYDAEQVVWNRDYSGLARERDDAVRQELAGVGISHDSAHGAVLHPPGTITTTKGEPYSVFSYYWRKWRDRETDDPLDSPATDDFADIAGEALPTFDELGFDEPAATIPDAGTEAARARLSTFCEEDIHRYDDRRDDPAEDGTSRLSPHLSFGTIGIREVYAATDRAMDVADGEAERDSVEEFRRQLAWREFYTQVLWAHPETVTEAYTDYERPIEWRTDPDGLAAWKAGETGYPIVDAGMRQLQAEAWMHNRVRMIAASFLTKDLLIDWRRGYEWFRERLIDHDTANNVGGWQWIASTGVDAQPYFRVFNPMTQGERYDPDAEYIKRYVPELREAKPAEIHGWPDLDPERREEIAPDYSPPLVDHGERREEAIELFERARGDD